MTAGELGQNLLLLPTENVSGIYSVTSSRCALHSCSTDRPGSTRPGRRIQHLLPGSPGKAWRGTWGQQAALCGFICQTQDGDLGSALRR